MIYISGHIRDPLCRQACLSRVSASGASADHLHTIRQAVRKMQKARLLTTFFRHSCPTWQGKLCGVPQRLVLSKPTGSALANPTGPPCPQPGGKCRGFARSAGCGSTARSTSIKRLGKRQRMAAAKSGFLAQGYSIELKPNRNFKDTIFNMLFNNPQEALTLFNTLNGTSYADPSASTS